MIKIRVLVDLNKLELINIMSTVPGLTCDMVVVNMVFSVLLPQWKHFMHWRMG
jgi:hypothetical protein